MKNKVIATRLDLLVDYECLEEGKKVRNVSSSYESPKDENLLTYLMKVVRPNMRRIDTRGDEGFFNFLEKRAGGSIDCVYCEKEGENGFIRFINSTDKELSISSYGNKIASFFLENKDIRADLCFLCRSIEKDFDLAEGLDVIPLRVRIENYYEDGKSELISPIGRMLVANINFPHSRY